MSHHEITVPKGSGIFCNLTLSPHLPDNGKIQPWPLTHVGVCEPISEITIKFNHDSSNTEQMLERCVLIIQMSNCDDSQNNDWRFIGEGIQFKDSATTDKFHDFTTEITPDGKTLLLTITDVGRDNNETIDYSFVAAFNNHKSGEMKTYISADPKISVGRPR